MSERLDRIEAILEGLATQQQANNQSIERLTEQQRINTQTIDRLAESLDRYTSTSETERGRFQAQFMAVERRLDEHSERQNRHLEEIERLWRYLFAQLESRGNGHGNSNGEGDS